MFMNSDTTSCLSSLTQFSVAKPLGTFPREVPWARLRSFSSLTLYHTNSVPTKWYKHAGKPGSSSQTNCTKRVKLSLAKAPGSAHPFQSPRKSPVNTGLWWTSGASTIPQSWTHIHFPGLDTFYRLKGLPDLVGP